MLNIQTSDVLTLASLDTDRKVSKFLFTLGQGLLVEKHGTPFELCTK